LEDLYKTIASPSPEIIFKEKSSTFYGYAFPIQSEPEVKPILEILRKQHPHAVHYCYAYQLGNETIHYRANDDGEPSNSGGMPIYRQIQSLLLTNVLIVVVRFFGGIKLGVGGLITAYKTTLASMGNAIADGSLATKLKVKPLKPLFNTIKKAYEKPYNCMKTLFDVASLLENRNFVGIDLSEHYTQITNKRCSELTLVE